MHFILEGDDESSSSNVYHLETDLANTEVNSGSRVFQY